MLSSYAEEAASRSSISETNIRRCNAKIILQIKENPTQKIWGLYKSLGASFSRNEAAMVDFVEESEKRDKD